MGALVSVDPSGHPTHVVLEHCESRPSPFPPVFDVWSDEASVIGVGGTQPLALIRFFADYAISRRSRCP